MPDARDPLQRVEAALADLTGMQQYSLETVRILLRLRSEIAHRLPEAIHGAALTGGDKFTQVLAEHGVDADELASIWMSTAKARAASPDWILDVPMYKGIAQQLGIGDEFETAIGAPARAWLDEPMREDSDLEPNWCSSCGATTGVQQGMLDNWFDERNHTLVLWSCQPCRGRWVVSTADMCVTCKHSRRTCSCNDKADALEGQGFQHSSYAIIVAAVDGPRIEAHNRRRSTRRSSVPLQPTILSAKLSDNADGAGAAAIAPSGKPARKNANTSGAARTGTLPSSGVVHSACVKGMPR